MRAPPIMRAPMPPNAWLSTTRAGAMKTESGPGPSASSTRLNSEKQCVLERMKVMRELLRSEEQQLQRIEASERVSMTFS